MRIQMSLGRRFAHVNHNSITIDAGNEYPLIHEKSQLIAKKISVKLNNVSNQTINFE